METLSYNEIAQSRPFRFIVGPNEKEFFMHADLVASMSKVLSVLVNGSCNGTAKLDEARTSLAVWADVDEGTFVRFCEFAYTSNYRTADLVLPKPVFNGTKAASIPPHPQDEWIFRVPPIEIPPAEVQAVEKLPIQDPITYKADVPVPVLEPEVLEPDFWSFPTSKKDKKKKKKPAVGSMTDPPPDSTLKKLEQWNKFKSLKFDFEQEASIESSNDVSASFAEVFLSHAQIYCLADCYDVERLRLKALGKLHATLVAFRPYKERIPDIVRLVQYSFDNSVDKGGRQDLLRSVLCQYTACRLEDLWKNIEFQTLFRSIGDFSHGVTEELLFRLS